MKKVQFMLVCCLMLCGSMLTDAQTTKPQKQNDVAAAEREVKEFFDSYAEDLRQNRREAIANRYDSRGYFRMGNGNKTLVPFEEVKRFYQAKWTAPKSFAWKDISIEVLSPEAVVVTALFDWQRETGEPRTFSYTGLLIKQAGKWQIRVEDESGAPPKPPQQERKAITLDPAALEKYVGQYQIAPNFVLNVTNENGKLIAQATGQPKAEIFAESETKFFLKGSDALITFVKDADGRITSLILHQRGRDTPAQKIK